MRIAVTGSAGFIGKHVVRVATNDGHEVDEYDRADGHDLSNRYRDYFWY